MTKLLRPLDLGDKTPCVCRCGMARHDEASVKVVRRAGVAGVSGTYFCKSPWLCPTCAPGRAAKRAETVERVFDATEAKGGAIVFLTLTVQHRLGQSLETLQDLVAGSCRQTRQGKPWQLAKVRWGILGTLVGPEVTWSPAAGWHFHLHLAVPVLCGEEAAAEAGEWMIDRYRSYIEKAGGRADRRAQDVQVVWRREDLADYVAKGSLAWEVSNAGATKSGRAGLTPWDLAARGSRGDCRSADLFREYAAVMPGTRSCVVTASLAKALGIKPEDPEEGEQPDEPGTVIGSVERSRWHRLLGGGHVAAVLAAVERDVDWGAVLRIIDGLIGSEEAPAFPARPSPTHWTPTDDDIVGAVTTWSGTTGLQASSARLSLVDEARRRGLILDTSDVRIIAVVQAFKENARLHRA